MKRDGRQLLRDYALYFAITLVIVGITLWLALTGDSDRHLAGRFFACVGSAMITFTLFIRTSKPLWHRTSFWVTTVMLLVMHCVFFWLAPIPEHIPLGMTLLFVAMELGFLNTVRVLCFRYHPPKGEEIV